MSTPTFINYYDLLGIKPSAKLSGIKKAFRQKQREYHPDRNKESINKDTKRDIASQLNKAYEILSNPVTRLEYDLQNGFKQQTPKNESTLQQHKKNQAENERENMIESARKSREIEKLVKIKTSDKIFDEAGLLITKASYGYLNLRKKRKNNMASISEHDKTENTNSYVIDVTDALQCMVQHRDDKGGFIMLDDGFDKEKLVGFFDPNPKYSNYKKYLEIEYSFNRQHHYVKVENFENLVIPKQEHVISLYKHNNTDDSKLSEEKKDFSEEVHNRNMSYSNATQSTAIDMYYQHDSNKKKSIDLIKGQHPKSMNKIDVAAISWSSMQKAKLHDVVDLPSGKVAYRSRPSLATLPKYEDIKGNTDEQESTQYIKINYGLLKWSALVMVVGITGYSFICVDRYIKSKLEMNQYSSKKEYIKQYGKEFWTFLIGNDSNNNSNL